jgi:VWFA-related protein
MIARPTRLVSTLLMLAVGVLRAQQPPAAPPVDSGAVIRTETRLVLVDAVVTDKKGAYIRDLGVKDFKVWEDNKEQSLKTFSFEAGSAASSAARERYLILFFDNASMNPGDQVRARQAAARFIEANAGPGRMMAIVNFGGTLQIAQNFTADAEKLKRVVTDVKFSAVSPNVSESGPGAMGQLNRAAADFGARDMILALRNLAKNLGTVPGRKSLVLLTAGFPLRNDQVSEVTATIDTCNKANVAIYPIDVRGLETTGAGADRAQLYTPPPARSPFRTIAFPSLAPGAFAFSPLQQTGSRGGGTTGSGATGGGTPSRGAPAGSSSSGSVGSPTGGATAPGGTRSNPGSPGRSAPSSPNSPGRSGGAPAPPLPLFMNPYNQSRNLIPFIPPSTATNQQVLFMLADGTGGFVIHDSNDLLGGMQKIGKEQDEYYIVGYTPPDSAEGSCHLLKVKVDRSGAAVRARTGYCNAKLPDLLAKNPIEKDLENHAAASQAGNITASMQLPYFYSASNIARVNVAMEIESGAFKFEKQKNKLHAAVNVLGIAYLSDGSVGARFSDTVKLDFNEKKDVEEFQKQPLHYENQFDIASGQYTFKVVFSSGGEQFGKLEMPLEIEPYQSNEFSVSGLALIKEVHQASQLGEVLDASLLEDRTPLMANGLQFVPSGSSHLKKSAQTGCYFELYEPLLVTPDPGKETAIAIQMRVLDRATGDEKADSGPLRVELPEKGGNPVIPLGQKMPVASLGPGAYVLELTAADTSGKQVARRLPFDLE